ncbi:MAG: hypothetical protein DRI44_05200 [Chlamydiae bacterium]|nr:MAG: hypothetical protein DRI44_05200 [Chlamydiota bacterium]
MKIHLSIFLFFFTLIISANKHFTARIYYNDVSDYNKLLAYDVLEYNNVTEKYFLAIVNDSAFEQLKKDGWKVSRDNIQTLQAQSSLQNFSSGYRTIDELYQDMAAITSAYPYISEIVDYGDAYCKSLGTTYLTPGGDTQQVYDLLAIKITNKKIHADKPVFFLMAGIHAREITTPEVAMRMIDYLTQNYENNADVRWIVDYQETWIVPSVNPEGHWIVELGAEQASGIPYSQRKNANHDDGSTVWPPGTSSFSGSQYGVDLNRNHSYKWGLTGSSSNPSDMTYRGSTTNSEPEVYELQNFLTNLFSDQRIENQAAPTNTTGILISMHSYSKLVLWPWGYTSANAPNHAALKMIGDKFATYNHYTSESSSGLYPTAGDTTDWTYGELGVPAFTFELGNSFMPAYSIIDSVQWPKNRPALLYAAKIARMPYMLIKGPDVSEVTFSYATGNLVKVSAKIDDSKNGGAIISSTELSIGYPNWISNSIPYQMLPEDGIFDSQIETVSVYIAINEFNSDTEMIFIDGQDADGNSGPVTAAFSNSIPEPCYFYFANTWILFIIFLRR